MARIDTLQAYDEPVVEEYTPPQMSVNPLVAAMRELQAEGILESTNLNEGPDGDYQTGGSLGLPFPGTYEQEYDNFKQHGQRRMTALTNETTGETITLNQLYGDDKPDRHDTIWDYGTMIWDTPYEIQTIGARKLDMFLCDQYNVEFIEDLFERMSEEQHEIVDNYIKDPNLSNKIIVLDNGYIVDGNHRAIAAALTKRPIKYVDISDEEEEL
jgi:hypothetical protein